MTKYIPKDTNHEVNTSSTHPLADFGILLVAFATLIAGVVVGAIYISDKVAQKITLDKEIELFSGHFEVSKKNIAPEKIQSLVSSLYKPYQKDKKLEFKVQVHPSDQMNAFASIGGTIGLTKGLLNKIESENELAFVICHEIGHHYNRDVIRGIGAHLILLLIQTSFGLDDSISHMSKGLTVNSFSRQQETSADEFALGCVNNRFGHVMNVNQFFRRLKDNASELEKFGSIELLSTHPLHEGRIEHLLSHAKQQGFLLDGEITPWE